MQRFSESVSFDARLAPFDVACSRAHAKMLRKIGVLTEKEYRSIDRGLREILKKVETGQMEWDPALEDVHMNIEQALTARTPAAAKLHTGRSRNDQVATDMRLFFKHAAETVGAAIRDAQRALLGTAAELAEAKICIPGYTHLQRAQPVPAAWHLLAYIEMLERDHRRFAAVHEAANVCPLGSGALAGSTLPLDREMVAVELGFVDKRGRPRLTMNSMDAVADRDTYLDFGYAATACGLHLSRMAEDIILWNSREFGFVRLPESYTTGSSLMPQKQNPDAMELVRGKAGRIGGQLQTLVLLTKNLPLTYNRDLQEDKPPVFDGFDQLMLCLQVSAEVFVGLSFDSAACARAVADPLLLATDLVDFLVESGVPFREAHHVVGALVREVEGRGIALTELDAATARAIHPSLDGDWRSVLEVERAMQRRRGRGMPGFRQVANELRRWSRAFE